MDIFLLTNLKIFRNNCPSNAMRFAPSTLRFCQLDSQLRASDRQKVGLIIFKTFEDREQLYFIISWIEIKVF
jgi:hypothetical protein